MKYAIALIALTLLLGACGHPTEEGILFRTADPALSIGFRWAEVEVGESEPVPPIAPPCEEIKLNISRDGRKLYHTPESPQYAQVKIDESKGEGWACDEQEAIDAGWRKAGN